MTRRTFLRRSPVISAAMVALPMRPSPGLLIDGERVTYLNIERHAYYDRRGSFIEVYLDGRPVTTRVREADCREGWVRSVYVDPRDPTSSRQAERRCWGQVTFRLSTQARAPRDAYLRLRSFGGFLARLSGDE